MVPADKVATYVELFSIPHNEVGEILAGELITHPRPAPKHARASSVAGAKLLNEFDTKSGGKAGGWWFWTSPSAIWAQTS